MEDKVKDGDDGSKDELSMDNVTMDGSRDVVMTTAAVENSPKDDEVSREAIVDVNIRVEVCSEVISNVDVCSEVITNVDICSEVISNVDVCSEMITNVDIC